MRGLRKDGLAVVLSLVLALGMSASLAIASEAERVPITEEEGQRIAEAALSYTEVQPIATAEPGMPFLWGGRTTLEELVQYAGPGGVPETVGVDASGLVVNVLRAVLGPDVRFVASVGGRKVRLADATSRILYEDNVQAVEPQRARPGDLLFFGQDGDISGVAVVVERRGDRIDFVVASARTGRVIRTFARIGGEYWQKTIVGVGRFLKPADL